MKTIVYAICILTFVSSCVSKNKFTIAENGRLAALSRERAQEKDLARSQEDNERLQKQISNLQQDTTRMGKSLKEYRQSLYTNLSAQEKLNVLLKEKMDKLTEREATINELQNEINSQKEKVNALLNSVKEALLGFSSDELSVTQKNGKVYVAMSNKLLFQSGSATVNKQGKTALGKLAEVLKKQTDIDILIEGHTDTQPIKTVQFKDNWDLSVVRATSVVRILTKEYGVNPLQIVPSGRGEYMPVDNNDTAAGRARNRRTEIIMAPRLEELMDILK